MRFFSPLHLRRPSITGRLILVLSSAVTLVMLVAIAWIYFDAAVNAKRQLSLKADKALSFLESVLTIPLWNYDYDVVERIGKTFTEDGSYEALTIRDSEGRTVFDQQREQPGEIVGKDIKLRYKGQDNVGSVSLKVSSAAMKVQAGQEILRSISVLLAIVITIILSTAILVRVFFRRPLNELRTVADAYGSGDYSIAGMKASSQEFQPLLDVMGKMGKRILEQISELQEREEASRPSLTGPTTPSSSLTSRGTFLR